jgi:hypothetical protein
MRPIQKGAWPIDPTSRQKIIFQKWTKAIPILRQRTGPYCHLCEMHVTNPIAIEHIFHQEGFPRLKANWNNFLLACNYCNSRKGRQKVEGPYRAKYFWPHVHNTLLKFQYRPDGIVRVQPALALADRQRAQRTISLYKLDAIISTTGGIDQRHLGRLKALKIAIDCRIEFQNGETAAPSIVRYATSYGFFAVWLSVFQDVPAVYTALVNCPEFHLAETGCFDAHSQLIDR